MSKKLIKKVKKIFINAVCAHSGPEYFLEHIHVLKNRNNTVGAPYRSATPLKIPER